MNALTILARTPVTVPTLSVVTTASVSSDLKGRIVKMVSIGIKMIAGYCDASFSLMNRHLTDKERQNIPNIPSCFYRSKF